MNHILEKQVNEALRQRIVVHYNFHGLTDQEVSDYIRQKIRNVLEKVGDYKVSLAAPRMCRSTAIKKAREKTGMTREQLARIVDYDPRHLQAVENEGQYPRNLERRR